MGCQYEYVYQIFECACIHMLGEQEIQDSPIGFHPVSYCRRTVRVIGDMTSSFRLGKLKCDGFISHQSKGRISASFLAGETSIRSRPHCLLRREEDRFHGGPLS